jgi:SnoaL-like domain
MRREDLKRWLEAYGRAWESLDARAATQLFAEDATYQETPFVEPLKGRAAILKYWQNVARTQESVRFESEILSFDAARALAHWQSRFVRLPMKSNLVLDGIFLLTFDPENRCTALREWWHRKEVAAGSGQ